jgi:hypothetical protein
LPPRVPRGPSAADRSAENSTLCMGGKPDQRPTGTLSRPAWPPRESYRMFPEPFSLCVSLLLTPELTSAGGGPWRLACWRVWGTRLWQRPLSIHLGRQELGSASEQLVGRVGAEPTDTGRKETGRSGASGAGKLPFAHPEAFRYRPFAVTRACCRTRLLMHPSGSSWLARVPLGQRGHLIRRTHRQPQAR